MKTLIPNLGAFVVLGLLTCLPIYGQESTTTTTTSTGTITEATPDAIAVHVATAPAPVRYSFTKTTTYVDENGNPVSIETVRTGVPVTVYYEREGTGFVADKVVVRKSFTTTEPAPVPAPVPTSTTTTTVSSQLPTPPMAEGIVTDAGSGHIDLRTPDSARPIHYKAHDATAYVDANGNPVSRKMLTPGVSATVFYEQDGDNLLATRVIVGR